MKKLLLGIVIIVCLFSIGCRQNNLDEIKISNSKTVIEYNLKDVTIPAALLTNVISNNNIGAYQILNHWNNTGIITYYDFETMNKIVLSSDINNSYTKDSTAYIDSVLGGVIPIVVNDHLFIIKNGSKILVDTSNENDGYGKIIKMNLNGSDRKELKIPTKVNMDFYSSFIVDKDENLYTLTYNIGDNIDDIKICLTKFDVSNNLIETIHIFEDYKNLKILKAYENEIVLQNTKSNNEGKIEDYEIVKFNIHTKSISNIVNLNVMKNSFVISRDCIYFSDKENKTISKIYIENLQQEVFLNDEIVSNISLYEFYDNRIIASYEKNGSVNYISIDSNGKIFPLSHFCNKNSDMKFIGVFGETNEDFIVSIEDKIIDYTIKNSEGKIDTIKMPILDFALINKNDYWNNIPNYRYFVDRVEYCNVPENNI